MSDAFLLEMEKEIKSWSVGNSKTWPYNCPGVDDELIDLRQQFLDRTFGVGKYKASKANLVRGHWLSLKIERIG